MTPIPGEPLDRDENEMTLGDGRKVKLRVPGLTPPKKPLHSEERGAAEPPREDPRKPVDPNAAGF